MCAWLGVVCQWVIKKGPGNSPTRLVVGDNVAKPEASGCCVPFVVGDTVARPEASGCCVPISLCHVIHGAPDFSACTINQTGNHSVKE